jgi:hypothetical protein
MILEENIFKFFFAKKRIELTEYSLAITLLYDIILLKLLTCLKNLNEFKKLNHLFIKNIVKILFDH